MKKSILTAFLAFFMLVFLPSLRTQAESQDGFMLDGTGAVTLQSQHAAKEEVSSLQFSLTVETEGEAQVEFVFEPNHARIAEFRYDEAAKKLNIYMAGVDPLFEENADTLAVGKVVVRNGSGGEAVAKVSVVEDSLQYVYGSELKLMEEVEIPEAVQLGSTSGTQVPSETPEPSETPGPAETPGPSERPVPPSEPQPSDPAPDQGTGDDPNAGWNPGWQSPEESSTAGGGAGNGRKPTGTSKPVGTKRVEVVSAASPSPTVNPSPEPSDIPGEPEDMTGLPVIDLEEGEEMGSAPAMTEQEETEENGPARKADWVLIVVVIAIVIFVAVAVVSVIALSGKKTPRSNGRG